MTKHRRATAKKKMVVMIFTQGRFTLCENDASPIHYESTGLSITFATKNILKKRIGTIIWLRNVNNKSRFVWTETRQYNKCERGRTKITRTLITQSFALRSWCLTLIARGSSRQCGKLFRQHFFSLSSGTIPLSIKRQEILQQWDQQVLTTLSLSPGQQQ